MKRLITAERVMRLAFSAREELSPEIITEADIVEAESRFLLPILGALYEPLSEGSYAELMAEYVAPVVAIYTRYVAEAHLAERCAPCRDKSVSVADNTRLNLRLDALRRKAATLARRLSDHLNAHADDYAEYDPQQNILNRCSTDGGIVQIF